MLRRRRLEEAVAFADGSHRTTVVSTPAGYGKTTLLADWSRSTEVPCAWLSLDPSAVDHRCLYRWIVRALHEIATDLRAPARSAVLNLDPRASVDAQEDCRRVLHALEALREPLTFIIDDVHLAGRGLDRSLLGALVDAGSPELHLVLASRGEPGLCLASQRLCGAVTDVRCTELAFTAHETEELMTLHGFNGPAEGPGLWEVTGGWPVAIAEGLRLEASGAAAPSLFSPQPRRVFLDYVDEEILSSWPPSLSDFVLRATTRNALSRALALDLCARDEGPLLLEKCIEEGLIFEDEPSDGAAHMYRWQPLFATACRALLSERDPALSRTLHAAAARHYQDLDTATCVTEALLGAEPRLGAEAIAAHWLEMVVAGEAETLEQQCLRLPFPWSEDPEVLLARSAARALARDENSADRQRARAASRAGEIGAERRRRLEINEELFRRFVLELGDPGAAVRQGFHLLDLAAEHPSTPLACALLLLGRTQARAAVSGRAAVRMLETAVAAGSANGLSSIEVCASAELAWTSSACGDFAAAHEWGDAAMHRVEKFPHQPPSALSSAWAARGMVAYWRDDLAEAERWTTRAIELGSDPFALDSVTVLHSVLIACATADPARITAAELSVRAFDGRGFHDSSWPLFSRLITAKLREAAGDLGTAAALVRTMAKSGAPPLASALIAELLRRSGEAEKALALAVTLTHQPAQDPVPHFLETSGALIEALIAEASGETATAHERLEHAVRCAEPESVIRPFVERRGDLLGLLVRHAARGTAHDAFLAMVLSHRPSGSLHRLQPAAWALSQREREVLAHMQTLLTAAEIADALFISVNTLKTHQQSIYRKLGATNRRSAVRLALAQGLL